MRREWSGGRVWEGEGRGRGGDKKWRKKGEREGGEGKIGIEGPLSWILDTPLYMYATSSHIR